MQQSLFKQATVWTGDNCPYCERAKNLLASKGYEMELKSINSIDGMQEFKMLFPAARTVPQIIIEGKYIGGYSELVKYLAE